MSQMSYGRALALWAQRDGDAPALVFGEFGEQVLSRAELDRTSNRLARVYREAGVTPGRLVTLSLPNGIEFFVSCLAVWKLGATPQPISAALPAVEREAIVQLSDPALIVGADPSEYRQRPVIESDFRADLDISDAPLEEIVSKCARAITSGGSTGRPKVIVDIRPALCDPDVPENRMLAAGVTLCPGPLYHAGPFITAWQAILSGGRAVVLPRFDAEACLRAIERDRVDWTLFVPTMMQRIWRLPEEVRQRYDISSLRVVMCSGAPSPIWLKRAWIEWIGPEKIFEAYGGAERIGGTSITGSEWLVHPGSVGKPLPGHRLKVLAEDGREQPAGQVGEIYMLPETGRGSTYRYIGSHATASSDGWETLGDLGYLDSEGYLYLVDRKCDMIVSGGANVYPAEVEAAIDANPAVRSSAVIGLPDNDLGQCVHAIVDAPEGITERALREHLDACLVHYKIPRSFEFVAEPLRNDAGKVRRSALREARLGLK
jgi:bile acid-coenzyme A ligase